MPGSARSRGVRKRVQHNHKINNRAGKNSKSKTSAKNKGQKDRCLEKVKVSHKHECSKDTGFESKEEKEAKKVDTTPTLSFN